MNTFGELMTKELNPADAMLPSTILEDDIFGNVLDALKEMDLLDVMQSPMRYMSDMFQADATILTGVTEVDHMIDRTDRNPIGIMRNTNGGFRDWPEGDKKIFLYVNHHPSLLYILKWIEGVPDKVDIEYESEKIIFTDSNINVIDQIQEADLCVNHGNFTTTMEFLLEGKPVVMMPTHGEQQIFASNVVAVGLGVMVGGKEPTDYMKAVHMGLYDKEINENVICFSEFYSRLNNEYYMEKAMGIINGVLDS